MSMTTAVHRTCPVCNKQRTFDLDAARYQEWQSGAHIQRAFPEMLPADRETLITGLCSDCFDSLFPEEK